MTYTKNIEKTSQNTISRYSDYGNCHKTNNTSFFIQCMEDSYRCHQLQCMDLIWVLLKLWKRKGNNQETLHIDLSDVTEDFNIYFRSEVGLFFY